ncbi:MAG: NrfD/PsrC family molybdoenzyme membrane anchor subunit [Candidatus Hodarchaeales archaeon]
MTKLVLRQEQEETFSEIKYANIYESMKLSKLFIFIISILFLIFFVGVYFYIEQLEKGLVVTGLGNRNFWGLYITNFVFFIGISHAGTLISAILRVTGAGWRTPITRMAEAITVFALIIGAAMVLIDLGRIDRILNVIIFMNINSPILWDFLAIATYLTGSILFLYLPLIPDMALLRDKLDDKRGLRYYFYRTFSLGWRGSESQHRRLERGISIMAILIIPIAISVHTVVSFIFSMTWRPGWHSSIFGPVTGLCN